MGRERVCLPFHFLLTSAQGHLKKANFSRKSSMHTQELHFLNKLDVLISSTIPSHPLYAENTSNTSVLELERQLGDVRRRIVELERKPKLVPKLVQKPSKLKSRIEKLSKTELCTSKETPDDACSSSDSSLRSKLTESVKLLSPEYSPRRLEKSLKAAARGSCLEQEASLQGKEWLKLELDGFPDGPGTDDDELKDFEEYFEPVPAKTRSPEQSKAPEDVKRSSEDPSTRTALTNLYKQLLGPASSGKLVQEFRQTLKALESSAGNGGGFAEQLARHEQRERTKVAPRKVKGEDEDFVSDFIASTRTLLDGGHKVGKQKQVEAVKVSEKPGRKEVPALRKVDRGEIREPSKEVNWQPSAKMRSPPPREKASPTPKTYSFKLDQAGEVESLVEAKVDKMFSEMMGTLVAGTEQALGCIRVELENAREVGYQLKSETENLKKLNEFKLDEFHQMLVKLQKDGTDMKAQFHSLKRLEESLRCDRENIRKLFEMIDRDGAARKAELQTIRKEQEELCNRVLLEGESEKAVIMERLERLSQLYIGGLEDVRMEVTSLKAGPESTARAESLLAEMRNRRKKSMQLESVMKNAVEAALKLQEKYSVELERAKDNWTWAMNLQIGEAKSVLGELTEQSQSLSAQLSSFEGHNVLLSRIQSIEGEVRQLMATVKPPLNESAIYDSIAKHKEVIQKELNRLDEQMQDALKKLENAQDTSADNDNLRAELEEKLREVIKSRAIILDKITEMGKKVRKLEGAQLNLVRSVEELRTSTSDLEISASTWLPKYETAASLLKDMDARLGIAESLIKGIEEGQAEGNNSDDEGVFLSKFDTLEDRVAHVASETLSEIRLLDSKVEQCKAGVQSALEGAALAENKCGVLGAEIVKVFRMFAARNGKLTELPGTKAQKEKGHLSCKSCKKANNDGPETSSSRKTVLSPEEHYKQGRQQQQPRRFSEGTSFIDSYAETLYDSGRLNSTNGKRDESPSTDDDEADELVSPKVRFTRRKNFKETKAQRTNIRLEAGKVVSVPH